MNDLERAIQLIKEGSTCALVFEGREITSTLRGVKPLMDMIASGEDLKRFSAADKVVGKAAALLYAFMGVKIIYAEVISRPAFEVLTAFGAEVTYKNLVPYIINRVGDGVCPMESLTADINDPKEALDRLRAFFAALAKN